MGGFFSAETDEHYLRHRKGLTVLRRTFLRERSLETFRPVDRFLVKLVGRPADSRRDKRRKRYLMKKRSLFSVFPLFFVVWVLLPVAAYCQIRNDGNVETLVVITTRDGHTLSSSLFPGETAPLPADAATVRVDNPAFDRGNEEIDVRIVLPGGLEGRIHENGGTYPIPPS